MTISLWGPQANWMRGIVAPECCAVRAAWVRQFVALAPKAGGGWYFQLFSHRGKLLHWYIYIFIFIFIIIFIFIFIYIYICFGRWSVIYCKFVVALVSGAWREGLTATKMVTLMRLPSCFWKKRIWKWSVPNNFHACDSHQGKIWICGRQVVSSTCVAAVAANLL